MGPKHYFFVRWNKFIHYIFRAIRWQKIFWRRQALSKLQEIKWSHFKYRSCWIYVSCGICVSGFQVLSVSMKWKYTSFILGKIIVGRGFLTSPILLRNLLYAYSQFFNFCSTPLSLSHRKSPPSLLFFLPCFLGWMGDRTTRKKVFQIALGGRRKSPQWEGEWEIWLWEKFFIEWVGIWRGVILTNSFL